MKYDQLDDDAKVRAVEHIRMLEQQDWDSSYYLEYIGNVLKNLGFTVETRRVKTYGGKTCEECDFSWSLGYCQGDGFRFKGSWDATDADYAKMLQDSPTDAKLMGICARIAALCIVCPQGRCAVVHQQYGCSLPSTHVECPDQIDEDEPMFMSDDKTEDMQAIVSDLCGWAYMQLREGYESDMEDECIISTIEANEWEFVESGEALA